jgi:hypothetical protein
MHAYVSGVRMPSSLLPSPALPILRADLFGFRYLQMPTLHGQPPGTPARQERSRDERHAAWTRTRDAEARRRREGPFTRFARKYIKDIIKLIMLLLVAVVGNVWMGVELCTRTTPLTPEDAAFKGFRDNLWEPSRVTPSAPIHLGRVRYDSPVKFPCLQHGNAFFTALKLIVA